MELRDNHLLTNSSMMHLFTLVPLDDYTPMPEACSAFTQITPEEVFAKQSEFKPVSVAHGTSDALKDSVVTIMLANQSIETLLTAAEYLARRKENETLGALVVPEWAKKRNIRPRYNAYHVKIMGAAKYDEIAQQYAHAIMDAVLEMQGRISEDSSIWRDMEKPHLRVRFIVLADPHIRRYLEVYGSGDFNAMWDKMGITIKDTHHVKMTGRVLVTMALCDREHDNKLVETFGKLVYAPVPVHHTDDYNVYTPCARFSPELPVMASLTFDHPQA